MDKGMSEKYLNRYNPSSQNVVKRKDLVFKGGQSPKGLRINLDDYIYVDEEASEGNG